MNEGKKVPSPGTTEKTASTGASLGTGSDCGTTRVITSTIVDPVSEKSVKETG